MAWLFPRIYDRAVARTEEACMAAWRADLIRPLAGDVLEIGAGTGLNLRHYPATVRRLVVTDPEPAMLERLRRRRADLTAAVELQVEQASADHLPFGKASFDAVVCTLVLCSVPDPPAVLAEVRRVLRPEGRLVFLEHVAAEGRPRRLTWQRRVEPVWKRVAGGCHLTRRTADAIEAAGFRIDTITRESARKALPVVRPTIRGAAVPV
ncbi:MAG: class I SAM-dependent methyltransferase [Actinobacteria bacterium]|nr:class I SAM-dependent methyltransferase [Actinomycetota bacterium]